MIIILNNTDFSKGLIICILKFQITYCIGETKNNHYNIAYSKKMHIIFTLSCNNLIILNANLKLSNKFCHAFKSNHINYQVLYYSTNNTSTRGSI